MITKSTLVEIANNCVELSGAVMTKILLFGDNSPSPPSNTLILSLVIDCVIYTEWFDLSILTHWQ